MNSLDIEIREWLTRYLVKELTFEQFEDWFVPSIWEVEKSGDQMAINLANEIESTIAEFTNGHLTENELKNKLRPLMQQYSVKVTFGSSASSVSYTTGLEGQVQSQFAGTISLMEPA